MRSDRRSSHRASAGRAICLAALFVAGILVLPATALGQATSTPVPPTPATTPAATAQPATPAATSQPTAPTATAQPTTATAAALSVTPQKAQPGATTTANGSGFKAGEVVDVSLNGTSVGTPTVNTGGTFSLSFIVPSLAPSDYGVLAKGRDSGLSAATTFTVGPSPAALSFSVPQAAPGTAVLLTGTGFQAGETVAVLFNGAPVGTSTADTSGKISVNLTVPSLAPGQYVAEATGQTSTFTANATFMVTAAGATPVATAAGTPAATASATPAPSATPGAVANAPAMAHDDRYFSQTGYRVDDDQVWGFFQQYGGLSTFGYPVSRTMTFLGCPVQMFQRQVIQVCPGQGPALINLLDPEIFPYTQVNGSTFPAPDNTMKANTPPVSDPNYAAAISAFVQANVPDQYQGQPVNFQQTFNTLGGLTIWGAPISSPQPDPGNANFIYQRFQRGIMHYINGQGTQSVLLADYLKAILMNQNVPQDLLGQARSTRFYNQYCPGQTGWLCRPNDLGGTDLTFAFEKG